MRTVILWSAPILLLLIGAGVLLMMARGRLQAKPPAALTADEQARIDDLIGKS